MIKMKTATVFIFLLISLIIYGYLNPAVGNKDFDLEFRVSNEEENFYRERNEKIDKKRFTCNDERYFNDADQYELILHSLDFVGEEEKIIIVQDRLHANNHFKTANITYKDEAGEYSPLTIEHKNDSVFIIQQVGVENNVIFTGKKE